MSSASKIEWTEHTWNPFAGCAVLSPGCTNCYAMKMAARLDAMGQPLYKGLTKPSKGGPVWRGTVRANPDALLAPLKRKKPTTYFVNSMSDLFYEKFDDDLIDRVFAVMALTPQHTYQVLTKRAERMRDYVSGANLPPSPLKYESATSVRDDRVWRAQFDITGAVGHHFRDWPLKNVWLGVSTERQKEADERIPHLLQTPAAVRFISAEPLLGPIDLTSIEIKVEAGKRVYHDYLHALLGEQTSVATGCVTRDHGASLDWVIVGGESGPGARPMHPQWARDLLDQCKAAGVPFFFKQWGGFTFETRPGTEVVLPDLAPGQRAMWGDGATNHIVATPSSKKSAGRLLDGLTHDEMPGRER